jgi:hypothetical protein
MVDEHSPKDMVNHHLLANFVHQVISPLNGVAGTLDNLANGAIPPEREQQRTRAARAQLEQAILLLRNLAFFSDLTGDQPQVGNNRKVKKIWPPRCLAWVETSTSCFTGLLCPRGRCFLVRLTGAVSSSRPDAP